MFFREFLSFRARALRRSFAENRTAKILTILGFVGALGVLMRIVYELFWYGFRYLAKDPFFGDALTLYIVELFLLVSFGLVLLSALASGAFTLFRAPDDALIMASPHHASRVGMVAGRMVLSSLWPLLVVIIPALLALDRVFGISLVGSFLALASVTLLVALAVVLAILSLFVVGILLARIGLFSSRRVAFATGGLFAIASLFAWARFRALDLVQFFQARMIDLAVPDLSPIILQFRVFPSHFTAQTIIASIAEDLPGALLPLCFLALLFLVAFVALTLLRSHYLSLWQRGEERNSNTRFASLPFASLIPLARSARGALLKKEVVAFIRNTRGMLWFWFILFIWLLQVGASRVMIAGISSEPVAAGDMPAIVGVLQFISVLYFVTMFVLRFVFPSFSAERSTSWIAAMSPVALREIFVAKLVFFGGIFTSFALFFALVNVWALGLPLEADLPVLAMMIIGTLLITTFGLALSAMFPNTETDDPERLSTTLPGIGFMLGALVLIGVGAFSVHQYVSAVSPLPYIAFLFGGIVAILLLVARAREALDRPII
jgi:hypothetical protein